MTLRRDAFSKLLAASNPHQLGYLSALFGVYLILFVCAWKRKKATQSTDDKQRLGTDVARRDSGAVPDAAIATNFQLLSVFPNVTFGIQGLIAIPILNILGFLLGNALTSWLLAPFLSAVRARGTLHQYIAETHRAPTLRRFTALVSLGVFIAVTCFELLYLSRISRSLIGSVDDNAWFILFAFLVVSLAVIAHVGQQRSELRFDRWLLLVAYIGMHAAIALLVLHAQPQFDLSTMLVFFFLAIMSAFRIRQVFVPGQTGRWRHGAIVISTIALFVALGHFLFFKVHISAQAIRNSVSSLTPSASGMTSGVFVMAAGASILPVLFYNFLDFSFWQKYQSEVVTDEPSEARARRLRRPFLMYVFESPLSWLLPVIIGVYAVGLISSEEATTSPIPAIVDTLARWGNLGSLVAILFYASLVAIAISTAVGYLISTSYLYRMDISRATEVSAPSPIPLIGITVILLCILLPIDMISRSIDQIIVLMLASFAPLAALTPLVMYPLIFRRNTVNLKPWAFRFMLGGIIISAGAGLGIGIAAAIRGDSPVTMFFWLPMPVAFLVACVAYLIAVAFGTEREDHRGS